jgi:NDP-sugar pyrophosphorylase family protein
MKAMILAAGLGSRLQPLTKSLPKALVPVNDHPLLQIVINRLKRFGISEIIINVHHQRQKILEFIKSNNYFDIRIELSEEDDLLETGGGIKKAGWFFDDGGPFLVHNVDILSNIDIKDMFKYHIENRVLATLAVRKRKTSRQLLFTDEGNMAGWQSGNRRETVEVPGDKTLKPISFMGIHIISPEIFDLLPKESYFSIIEAYLQLVREGKKIIAYRGDRFYWFDVGSLEKLREAEKFLNRIQN